MLIYTGSKADFLRSVDKDTIADELKQNLWEKMHRRTLVAEFRSWENSLNEMYIVLSDPSIPADAGIAIEYNIPQTSKRIDFLISGYDKEDDDNVVIVELKQWDKIELVESKDALVSTYTGGGMRQVVHPSYQAWSYAMLLSDYNEAVQKDNIGLWPCAYLHNYKRKSDDPIDDDTYSLYTSDAPVFTKGQRNEIRGYIKDHVARGDDKDILYTMEYGRIRPSKSLQDAIAGMLHGNPEFIMLDEQKVIYEEVLDESRKCAKDGKKRVIIVQGGPGTGKTVVAINLLAELTLEDQVCQYVSKNSAPRNCYREKLKGEIKKSSVDNLFKGPGIYVDAEVNSIGTILADEAHRLNEKSGMFRNYGENQIKEIIHAARCSVFFIDESQRVTVNDIGSVEEIKYWAKLAGAEVKEMKLESQFRCNGSDGYLAWLDNVLEIEETANYTMDGIDYDIRILNTPEEVRDLIVEKNAECNNKARVVAGYCWDWIKEGKNDPNVHDIKIGDFEMSWNLGNDTTYAISEGSVNEAGCIHTVQGLEFDYVGVLIGDDMRYDNGHIVTDYTKRASTDQSIKGIKKMFKENPGKAEKTADEIIKNTYRTLMTRGMKGCYVYCTDKKLADHLRESLSASQK